MKRNTNFNGDLLRYKSLEDYVAFKDMHDLIHNEKAIQAHMESYNLFALEPELHDENTGISLRQQKSEGVFQALNHFGGLSIISLCTTYEIAVRDFLKCFFIQQPSHMFDFLSLGSSKGTVSLKEILKVSSHSELLYNLANNSAAVAAKGKYGEMLVKIAKLCNENIDKDIVEKLNKIQKIRNKIVHEKHTQSWEINDVEKAEELIGTSIEQICIFGLKNKIPGHYSCISNENQIVIDSVAGLTQDDI